MIQAKNAYTGRGLSRPCHPLKNPHVSFPKRWTLDLLDPSQGPWLNLPKLKRWRARNDNVFEKVADAKLFHAFPCLSCLSCISASPITSVTSVTSVTRAASPVMPFGSFRYLLVRLPAWRSRNATARLIANGAGIAERMGRNSQRNSQPPHLRLDEVHLVKAKNNALRHG